MASRNFLLPTVDQCYALTDEQCRMIMEYRDPEGIRAQRNWEPEHQAELVRQYMTMRSFPQIEQYMRAKLDWSYKTYANRYRDWLFPVDRVERELAIIDLYGLVTGANRSAPTEGISPAQSPLPPQIRRVPSQLPQTPLQAPPSMPLPPPPEQRVSTPTSMYSTPLHHDIKYQQADRMSIATVSTYSNPPSEYSSVFDDASNPRFSISTSDSSISSGSQFSVQPRFQHMNHQIIQPRLQVQPRLNQQNQRKPFRPPKHDPRMGIWNSVLRVIPCLQDHSRWQWDKFFPPCHICGFSPWHALMINARNIGISSFITAIPRLRDVPQADFVGNRPIHFLMAAGVGLDYFEQVLPWADNYSQNTFGQNPLHLLNPQDLGEGVIILLKWFQGPMLGHLLGERDIRCHTPLHELLQYPFERDMYRKIFDIFPIAAHHLRSFDTSGKTIPQLMQEASLRARNGSTVDYVKIQAGIAEVKMYLTEVDSNRDGNIRPYGFHHIARGARGVFYFGFFQCRICNTSDAHTNSYIDQMKCACSKGGIDRNAPDDTGMTPAHLLVTHARCNDDREQTPETSGQTYELFRQLIFNSTLREALHVLDPEGNSLVFNIATRGFHEILDYVLTLEEPERKCAMVNACGRDAKGKEKSALEIIQERILEVDSKINTIEFTKNHRARDLLCQQYNRLKRCKHILIRYGAELKPTVTKRWRITPMT